LAASLRDGIARHHDALLQAPAGAGKSTLVPLALLEHATGAGERILMLEPRRLAARAIAARMANLRGEPVGRTVGYRMHLDTRVSADTRIEVVTEGVLTRLLQEDPALEQVAWLIFDEHHERSLAADLGLALALDARRQLGARFRVLIMSATLESERAAALLTEAALIHAGERAFPVQIRYLGQGMPALSLSDSTRAVTRGVERALGETSGDVLVFLAGAAQIRAAQDALAGVGLPAHVQVSPLHGQMSPAQQDAALSSAPPGRRRVVLATNVAETSVTIVGVTAVVDSGLVRRARFDPGTGMGRLELARISRASSEQRAGRAGRVAPGVCYRLWSEGSQASLAATTPPEIMEADLAPLALELARWGAHDAAQLPWLDAPPEGALAQARALLTRLEALDGHGLLTERGRQMSRLPVHPRLAHMLLGATERDGADVTLAAQLAALLSERDVLPAGFATTEGAASVRGVRRDPDLRTRLELLRQGPRNAALDRLRDSAQRLVSAVRVLRPAAQRSDRQARVDDQAGGLLALAFPDRIGQRREGGAGRYLLSNGRGVTFAEPVPLAREPWIVAVEVDDRDREGRIELAAPLSRELISSWLGSQLRVEEQFGWDETVAALLTRRVRRLGALILEEQTSTPDPHDERTLPAMLHVVQRLGLEALPWTPELRELTARMQFVRSLGRPELADWPASDDATLLRELSEWLGAYLIGFARRSELARVPLREALLGRLSSAQRRALETLAPREIRVPSGSVLRIDYQGDNAPSLSVRLQELFGLADTPRIASGAVPLTLQLLSPARRPVQVTRDLAGFWRGSYADVRKDMRGRYPKHDWPEDPLAAEPTRRAKRRSPSA
jgi:ATP-dependent helicase HrpB